jgi:hypothetical protein
MSAPRVDVLAGIRRAAQDCDAQGNRAAANELLEIAGAVADLIEAHAGLVAMVGAGSSLDYRALQEHVAMRRARSALARIGGAI